MSERRNETSLTQEAADWHARLRSDTLSEVEETRFRAWLSGDPARRREFDEISALWDKLEAVAQSPEVLAERRPAGGTAATPERGGVSRRAVVGWALAAGAAGAAGFLSWQRLFSSDTYATAVGEQRTVPLSDGSVVTLNTSSQVRVRFSHGERRIDILGGQVNFEVAKDPARPFVVRSTNGGEVRALGTVFDVYERTNDVVVTLLEGRVAVTPGEAAGIVELSAGQQVTFGGGHPAERTLVDVERASAWRLRKLIFVDTPLAEAIAEANRYSRQQIELRAPDLAGAKISGTFDAGRNEALAEGLQAYFGLQVAHTGPDRIVLSAAQSR
jgi:transmembrane sensor